MSENNCARDRIKAFGQDTTIRWSTREGDIVLWMGYRLLASPEKAVTVNDVWQMRDGEFVTFTNRLADIPAWFALCIGEMTARLSEPLLDGFQGPNEPFEGPNVWRIGTGSRVAWIRPSLGVPDAEAAILEILDFRANALGLGETDLADMEHYMGFGTPTDAPPDVLETVRAACRLVQSLGCPRSLTNDWLFGA